MKRFGTLIVVLLVLCASAGRGAEDYAGDAPPHGEAQAREAHGGGGGFDLDPGLQLWTLLTFAALLWLLWKYAFPPIARALEERERAIRASVEEAQQRQKEAENLLQRYKDQLDKAHEETGRILDEGRRLAETTRQEITEKARAESKQILERAEVEIDDMKAKGIDELRKTVAHMSVEIASRVLRAEIDESAHRRLVDELLAELKDQHGTRSL